MRRAFTLIEMLTAISVGAVIMSIAVGVLIVLLDAEQNGRDHSERCEALRRLADQFRRDVHAAVGQPVDAAGAASKGTISSSPARGSERSAEARRGCRLPLADGKSVQYSFGEGGVSREERSASKIVRRESYSLSKDSTAAMTMDRTTNPWTVSLVIAPNDASTARAIRIDALLGRDHRFAERSGGGK